MTLDDALRDMVREVVREELRARAPDALTAPQEVDRFLSDVEVAKMIGVSRQTLQTMRTSAFGPPFVRVARRAVRYSLLEVKRWLVARQVGLSNKEQM